MRLARLHGVWVNLSEVLEHSPRGLGTIQVETTWSQHQTVIELCLVVIWLSGFLTAHMVSCGDINISAVIFLAFGYVFLCKTRIATFE